MDAHVNDMPQTIKFAAYGRRAQLLSTEYVDIVGKATSFSSPSARWSNSYIKSKEVRERLAAKGYHVWDGRKHMMVSNKLSIGLLRAKEVREELAKQGYKVQLVRWKDRPSVNTCKGFLEKDAKYDYQNKCINAMLKAIPFGGGLIISATGTGKTKIAGQFASWIKDPILFVVDQKDLLYQGAKEIEDWLHYPVGVVGDSKFQPSDRLTVATIQTLHKHRKNPLFKRWLKKIKVVIIDEIHVQMGRRNFSVITLIKPAAVFGLTATLQLKRKPVRMRAYSIAGPVVFSYSVEEGMQGNVLTKGIAVQVEVHSNKEGYDHAVVKNRKVNNRAVEFVLHAIEKGYYCVVIVERIKHIKFLEQLFKGNGVNPAVAYGAVGVRQRQRIRKKFEAGKEHLILANIVFKKGINLKRVDLIVDLAQRQNKNDVMQKFGRGVRLHTDKSGLLYYDFKTIPSMEKAGKSRFNALKKAHIPVVKTDSNNPKELLELGEKTLKNFIEGSTNGKSK